MKYVEMEPRGDQLIDELSTILQFILQRTTAEEGKKWLTARQAAVYTNRSSVKAWYEWRRRHGIPTRRSGMVSREDIDRALSATKRHKQMAKASLRNLMRKRRKERHAENV